MLVTQAAMPATDSATTEAAKPADEPKAEEKACTETKTDIATKEEVLTSPRSALSVFGPTAAAKAAKA